MFISYLQCKKLAAEFDDDEELKKHLIVICLLSQLSELHFYLHFPSSELLKLAVVAAIAK